MKYAIEAESITKCFGDKIAVDNLSLQVPESNIYGFLGPNGCGKSTTIRLLTGLLSPTKGYVDVLGAKLPEQAEALRYQIGYMTQKFSLYTDLTVIENLNFVAKIFDLDGRTSKKIINEALGTYNLYDIKNQIVNGLSGGQKQRLALACAVLHRPKLLFLDEPTSAVDPENRRDFWESLFELCDTGTTILVSTHYMDEAERCHQLAILDNGILVAHGAPRELMQEIGASVLEVEGDELRAIKNQLLPMSKIKSVAQQGIRLRVLVDSNVDDPVSYIKSNISNNLHISKVRASLEDVFVNFTGIHSNEK